MTKIVGHDEIRGRIAALVRGGIFPQTSLFYGQGGSGKKLVALETARFLLCPAPVEAADGFRACGECASCRLLDAGNHPDFFFISDSPAKARSAKVSDDDDESPPAKAAAKGPGSIKTEQVVELKKRLAFPPLVSERQVVVIDNAELMTETTANSLLKVLEEPRSGRFFILVTGRFHRILVTIRSRCAKFFFKPLVDGAVRSIVAAAETDPEKGTDPGMTDFYLRCFPGAPALVARALKLPLGLGDYERALDCGDGFLEVSELAAELASAGADLPLFFQCLRRLCLDRIRSGTAAPRAGFLLDRLTEAERRLERHIQAEFVLENLLL